jgi:hypothetical protein
MSLVSRAHRHDLDVERSLDNVMRQLLSDSTDDGTLPDIWKQL